MKKVLIIFIVENIFLFVFCYFTMDLGHLLVIDYFLLTLLIASWLMFAIRLYKFHKR